MGNTNGPSWVGNNSLNPADRNAAIRFNELATSHKMINPNYIGKNQNESKDTETSLGNKQDVKILETTNENDDANYETIERNVIGENIRNHPSHNIVSKNISQAALAKLTLDNHRVVLV